MIRPGKGSRTGATEAREESTTSGACAGLGDRAVAIVRAHRPGMARPGLLVARFDQSGFLGAWSTVAKVWLPTSRCFCSGSVATPFAAPLAAELSTWEGDLKRTWWHFPWTWHFRIRT